MHAVTEETTSHSMRQASDRYAKCIAASKRIRWDIDRDVIRGRQFDFTKKFMPDGLSKLNELTFLRTGRDAVSVADPGPHLRQHLRAGRALHRRQDPRSQRAITGSATRSRWKRWCASPTRS